MNARGKRPHIVQEAQHNFSRFSTNWGFNKLTLRASLLDPAEGWLDKQGNLQLRVDVRQVVPYWVDYTGIERQHYDTVRSSVALWSEMQGLGVKDLMVTYSITDDGHSRVGYNLKGQFYGSAAELRAALASQSDALRSFFGSSGALPGGGESEGPSVRDVKLVHGGGAPGQSATRARGQAAGRRGGGGSGTGGQAGGGPTASSAVGGGEPAPPASSTTGAGAPEDRYSSLFSSAAGPSAVLVGPEGAASPGLLGEVAAQLSWLLGGYGTMPVAVGGVAYLALAVLLRLWRLCGALAGRGKCGKTAEGGPNGVHGKSKGGGGCKNGAKVRPAKAKARGSSSVPSTPATAVGTATAPAASGPHAPAAPPQSSSAQHHAAPAPQHKRAPPHHRHQQQPSQQSSQQQQQVTAADSKPPVQASGGRAAGSHSPTANPTSDKAGPGASGDGNAPPGITTLTAVLKATQQRRSRSGLSGPCAAAPSAPAAGPSSASDEAGAAASAGGGSKLPPSARGALAAPAAPNASPNPPARQPAAAPRHADHSRPQLLVSVGSAPGPADAASGELAVRPGIRSCASAKCAGADWAADGPGPPCAAQPRGSGACGRGVAEAVEAAALDERVELGVSPALGGAVSVLGLPQRAAGAGGGLGLTALPPLPVGPISAWLPAPASAPPDHVPSACSSPLVQAFSFGDPLWQVHPLSPSQPSQQHRPQRHGDSHGGIGLGPGSELCGSLQPFFDRRLQQRLSLSCGGLGNRGASATGAANLLAASISLPPAVGGQGEGGGQVGSAGGCDEDDDLDSSLPARVANSLLDAAAREDDRHELERRSGGGDSCPGGGSAVSRTGAGGTVTSCAGELSSAKGHSAGGVEGAAAVPETTAEAAPSVLITAPPAAIQPAGTGTRGLAPEPCSAAAGSHKGGGCSSSGRQAQGRGTCKPRGPAQPRPAQPELKPAATGDAAQATAEPATVAPPMGATAEALSPQQGAVGASDPQATPIAGHARGGSRTRWSRLWSGKTTPGKHRAKATPPAALPSLAHPLLWVGSFRRCMARHAASLLTTAAQSMLAVAASIVEEESQAAAAGASEAGELEAQQAAPALQAASTRPPEGATDGGDGGPSAGEPADECGGCSGDHATGSGSGWASSGEAGHGSSSRDSTLCGGSALDGSGSSAGGDGKPTLTSTVSRGCLAEGPGGADAWLGLPGIGVGPSRSATSGGTFALPGTRLMGAPSPRSLSLTAAARPLLPGAFAAAPGAAAAPDGLGPPARGTWDSWGMGGGSLTGSPLCDAAGLWSNPWSQRPAPFAPAAAAGLGLADRAARQEARCQVCLHRNADVGFLHEDGVCLAACATCTPVTAASIQARCCPLCRKSASGVLAVRAVAFQLCD